MNYITHEPFIILNIQTKDKKEISSKTKQFPRRDKHLMEHTLNSNTRISISLPKSYSKDDMCISSKEENKCKHLFKALKIQNGSLHLMQVWFKLLETLPRSMSLATSLSKTNFKVLELLISGRRYR